jgi:excisionase family DNA binding protein
MSESISVNELTAIEAARRLGIDLNRVYMLLRLGRLYGRKVDGEWRVPGQAVEERLQRRQRAIAV